MDALRVVLCCLVCVSGCTSVPRHSVPADLVDEAQIPGIPNARFWGDEISPQLEESLRTMTRSEIATQLPALFAQPHNYLALSGGGAEGAYGAGLLVGWTETGERPAFQVVTGVSTGALISVWAFLGPAYDKVLREVYTKTTTDDILEMRSWLTVPFSDAVADSTPLRELIQRHVNGDVIARIAAEYRKGRRLYIGTTDLDFMRPRIWNIGAIAASESPMAAELIRDILLASASIPGAFPPVWINVEAGGIRYDELHVDGGTATQVFVYPAATDWRKALARLEVPEKANLYVIRNATLKPEKEEVALGLVPIANRSISSLIRTQGIGDLILIYALALRDGVDFHLAFIPETADDIKASEPFDSVYMNRLFEQGYATAKNGYPWLRTPPGWETRWGPEH